MTPEEFTAALEALQWSQADFNRKVGTDKSTASSWATGKTPIPKWVGAYLESVQDLAALHAKYVAPPPKGKPTALKTATEIGGT